DLGVAWETPPESTLILAGGGVEDPIWFRGARLNVAATALSGPADRAAILFRREGDEGIRRMSLGELRTLAERAAGGFRALGLAPGDAVALYLPMTPECVAAYLGVVLAGMRVVSIADSFPPNELARRLEIGGAKAVVTVDRFLRAGKEVDLLAKVVEARAPRAVVIADGRSAALRDGDLAWEAFLGPAGGGAVAAEPSAVTNVLFSSGTTGDPKAIPWTHLTPLKAAADGRFHHDLRAGDTAAWPTSVGWMMGPWLIYASLLNGAAMALYEGTPAGAGFCRFVADAGVTMLGVVPSLVRAWRDQDATRGADWSRLRAFSSTGEASHREDYLWLMSRAGWRAPVIEYCGGTEIGGGHLTGTVVQPCSPAAFTTPALGIDFVVLDPKGKPVPIGATGELYLLPPSVGLSQTLLNADHHAVYYEGCPAGPDGRTLRRHGDAVERLGRGCWRAHGRADDTMNLGGIKVSSLEIERVVDAHPLVHTSAAVAVQPGGEGADRLVLFVVPRGTPDPATLRGDLQARISGGLNPLFRVHDLVLVDSLPRTASNKLVRKDLRRRWKG
ncbi:MAG TPA: AMP-binding protein, partial [Planctomycetota bacterium]|nr:AMP-binding protein [Planctomycetota bacterium]